MNTPADPLLRRAWALCRTRRWPATYEATMADPLRAKLVAACATGIAQKARQTPAAAQRAAPRPGALMSPAKASGRGHTAPLFTQPLAPGFIDNKRRASGERED